MRTVSPELAAKLKHAGLQWEPKEGDFVLDAVGDIHVCVFADGNHVWFEKMGLPARSVICDLGEARDYFWLPTLSDLMEWLEGQGYWWNLDTADREFRKHSYQLTLYDNKDYVRDFEAETHEDAVAQAVLWVLEQEKDKEEGA